MFAELRFGQPGQSEIEVVAAEQQMFADRRAGELNLVALARDADQRAVAGATTDVADQDNLPIEEQLAGASEIVEILDNLPANVDPDEPDATINQLM